MTLIKASQIVLASDRTVLSASRSPTRASLERSATAMGDIDHQAPVLQPDDGSHNEALFQEHDALRTRVAELESDLATLQASMNARLSEAFERGAEAERTQFVRSEAERVAALRGGVADALRALNQQLDQLHRLASDIALTAVARVLGDPSTYANLVTATIRHRLGLLTEGSALAIRVAATDFPDEGALAQIRSVVPQSSLINVVADPMLTAGACLFDLQLGKIDISLPLQHERVATLLQESLLDG